MDLVQTKKSLGSFNLPVVTSLSRGQVIRVVRELSSRERTLFENILGLRLGENQRLQIQLLPPDNDFVAAPLKVALFNVVPHCKIYEGLDNSEMQVLDRSIRRPVRLNRASGVAHE